MLHGLYQPAPTVMTATPQSVHFAFLSSRVRVFVAGVNPWGRNNSFDAQCSLTPFPNGEAAGNKNIASISSQSNSNRDDKNRNQRGICCGTGSNAQTTPRQCACRIQNRNIMCLLFGSIVWLDAANKLHFPTPQSRLIAADCFCEACRNGATDSPSMLQCAIKKTQAFDPFNSHTCGRNGDAAILVLAQLRLPCNNMLHRSVVNTRYIRVFVGGENVQRRMLPKNDCDQCRHV